jgi:hypothetical protein
MTEKLFQVSEEKLFQVLEEKLMILLSERENIIRDNQQLCQENTALKNEKEHNMQRLEVLISLLASTDIHEKTMVHDVSDTTTTDMNMLNEKLILVEG